MPATRSSNRSEQPPALAACLVCALLIAACSQSGGFATASSLPDAPRRPDGVSFDRPPAPLVPSASASVGGPEPSSLSAPVAIESAFALLDGFFDAVVREQEGALHDLLAGNATWSNPSLGRTASPMMTSVWAERFRKLDYRLLADRPLFRASEVEVFDASDVANPPPGRPVPSVVLAPAERALRLRIVTPRLGPDRYFGDEITFVVRPEGGRYLIRAMYEDYAIP